MTMSERKLQCCVLEVRTLGRGSGKSGYEHARAHTWLLVQLDAPAILTVILTPVPTATIAELKRALLCCFQAQLRVATSKVGSTFSTRIMRNIRSMCGPQAEADGRPRALLRGLVSCTVSRLRIVG